MTLPFERTRSVLYTKQFLEELLDPRKTPRVPRALRGKAKALLRHYPMAYDIHRASNWAADVFGPVPEVHIGADAVRVRNFTFTISYQPLGGDCSQDELIERFGAAGFGSVVIGQDKPGVLALQLTCLSDNGQDALFSTLQAFRELAPGATLIDVTEHVPRIALGIALHAI
jgi:hypothetical protein